MNIPANNFINNIPFPAIQLPEDSWLIQLIEKMDEKACLNFLKNCRLDPLTWTYANKSLVRICVDNSWDHTLKWLSNRGINLIPDIIQAISSKDHSVFKKLLDLFKGNINDSITENANETL